MNISLNPKPIKSLPAFSRSLLRSTTILTSLPQIISELVQNSLDAGASHVEVGVDVEQWQCWVRDDGHGMSKDDMSILAKAGEEGRYGSSKAYDPTSLDSVSTFGFRGEALASAANLSCLEMSSRSAISRDTWSVILKGNKKLYYSSAVRHRREKPGTTVFIRDAFHNLPIRRKSHPNTARTLELIRKDLECVALVCPDVSFTLENSGKENVEGKGRGRIMSVPKVIYKILFEGLSTYIWKGTLRDINRYPLSPCDFHRVIDTQFSSSSFGRHVNIRRSPRKNERRPVYVLNITIPPNAVDNTLEPAKSAMHLRDRDAACSFLESVVHDFLVRNAFASARINRFDTKSPSPKKKRKISCDDLESIDVRIRLQTSSARPSSSKARPQEYTLNVDPFTETNEDLKWVDPQTGQAYHIDPQTGNTFAIEQEHKEEEGVSSPKKRRKGRTIVDTSRLRRRSKSGTPAKESMPEWMQETLEGWQNPTFGRDEPGIPTINSVTSFSRKPWLQRASEKESPFDKPISLDTRLMGGRKYNADDVDVSFNRSQLKKAQVIGQVDSKYVSCLVPTSKSEGKVLVLVDQHAADERVRVERFLKELCQGFLVDNVETLEMKPAVPVLLTALEARTLTESERCREAFARWGFRFTENHVEEQEGQEQYRQVHVESVPEVVSEKILMADELRELVKGFLARLEADLDTDYNKVSISDSHWTSALRYCPRELLELVNSKACRGAIMFNDSLKLDQCERLISQLSDTVWPFMCAHGRYGNGRLPNLLFTALLPLDPPLRL
ncbi:hypothetical protein M422DRAFT_177918 [Sphaerobolus stellatus SS14]|uniref:MutL C-terminal dimerisation domain-containing protein n=1 Tax=Sphaerobolus stellatus (strain SS14) TaxID=990650 RepID=A0A0C9VIN2_SPHS4|nr:hypothetical protein M422DRAFT_177918 [Sphaerobolus stellatus SS14]